MNKIKKLFLISLILIINVTYISFSVKADSGLDAKYDSGGSLIDTAISSGSSGISFVSKLLKANPNEEGYKSSHIVLSIICIIIFYIFTNIYVYKLDKSKAKKIIVALGISLFPTLIFALFCLLTELPLILYIIILIFYIIIFNTITKRITKKRLQVKINNIKEIDREFNVDEFNNETFSIYKEIQLAWMNFELDKVKNLISEEMFNRYKEQLEKLKSNKEQNIIEKIEYKSNKIIDIKIENNIEMVECQLNVTCYDYIINGEEKVIKGKKNKKNNYLYKLIFNKNLDNGKYVLVKKQMIKQK